MRGMICGARLGKTVVCVLPIGHNGLHEYPNQSKSGRLRFQTVREAQQQPVSDAQLLSLVDRRAVQ